MSSSPDMAESSRIDDLRAQWINACMVFDELSAENLLNQAFAIYPVETVCVNVLQASLREMGERWYKGEGSVQQEHFASALAVRRLESLIAATPRPVRSETVMLSCTPNEWHTFPVLLLCLLLRRKGLNVIYLGANTPSLNLVETIRQLRPNLVVLAAQQLFSALALRQLAQVLQKEHFQTAYGGWIFSQEPDLCTRIPAHYLGANIEQAAGLIQQLCITPHPLPDCIAPDSRLLAVARLFQQKRPQIELDLSEKMQSKQLDTHYLDTANIYLGNELLAALELGSLNYLKVDMQWIRTMLEHNQSSTSLMFTYISAYSQSVGKHLGAEGQPISSWMEKWVDTTQGNPSA